MQDSKDSLIQSFQRFPGIGPKQAERFTYFIMKQNKTFIDKILNDIASVRSGSRECELCYMWYSDKNNFENKRCYICTDNTRDTSIVLIVEKELDVNAVEKTSEYNGVYFVTGGKLPFLVEDPKEHIRIRELVETLRLKLDNNNLTEIIFALPANDEGDNQMNYIKKIVSQIVGIDKVLISTLARGVSTGLEMEYIDHDTFKSAFNFRK
jgi:recombination protein RecR